MFTTAHNQNFVMDSRGWEGETERVCVREREGECPQERERERERDIC